MFHRVSERMKMKPKAYGSPLLAEKLTEFLEPGFVQCSGKSKERIKNKKIQSQPSRF